MANERPTIVDALKQGMVGMFVDAAGKWWPKWVRVTEDGVAQVTTAGAPADWERRTATIDGADDVITDLSAPLADELITFDNFKTGAKKAIITFNVQAQAAGNAASVPFAAAVMVALNCSDDGEAVQRFTLVDVGAGDTGSVDVQHDIISAQEWKLEIDLTGTDSTVDRIDLGGIAPVGTGALPVYINIKVK